VKKFKALIAEDVLISRIIFHELLSPYCSICLLAEDGQIAIDILSKNPDVEIIFSDIEMPEVNGFELVEHIRKKMPHSLRAIPVIAISSHSSSEFRKRCLSVGFTDILTKPISKQSIENLLSEFF